MDYRFKKESKEWKCPFDAGRFAAPRSLLEGDDWARCQHGRVLGLHEQADAFVEGPVLRVGPQDFYANRACA